ncbi:thiocillin family RiPP [Solibacillus silvestris]
MMEKNTLNKDAINKNLYIEEQSEMAEFAGFTTASSVATTSSFSSVTSTGGSVATGSSFSSAGD